jgi:hypothetical protein
MAAGDQLEVLADRFIDFAGRVDDLSVPLAEIRESLLAQVEESFATEGAGSYTGAWQPLSAIYGAWKAKRSGAPILVGLRPLHKGTRHHPARPETYGVSGTMKAQMLDPASAVVSPMSLLYTPVSNIAGFHQTGTPKMPARPIVSLYPATLNAWGRYVVEYLDKLAAGVVA